jgi:hypothetical protein
MNANALIFMLVVWGLIIAGSVIGLSALLSKKR